MVVVVVVAVAVAGNKDRKADEIVPLILIL